MDKLERAFKITFPKLLGSGGVMQQLHTEVEGVLSDAATECENCLNIFSKIGKKYMGLRVHHVLDVFNNTTSQERGKGKGNKKMQKLLHI